MHSMRAAISTDFLLRAALLLSFLQLVGFVSPALAQSAAPPSITLTASAREVAVGRTTRLSWTTTGAQRCVGSGPGWNQTYEGTAAARGSFTTGELKARTNEFSLTCTGAGGTSVQSVTVAALPVPKVTLEASSDRALPGGAVQLTWRSEDATSCTASGAPFSGTKPASGTERLNELTKGTKTFKVTCKGVGGSGSADVKVAVVGKPTLTFSASKTQIAENTGTQLKWKATDATSCLASDNWNGPQGLSGSFNTGNLSSDKTYTLTCTGLNGEVEQTVKVQVVGAPRVTLNVSDGIVAPGESVTLNWTVEDAQSCTASGSPFTGSKNPAGASETLSNLTKGAKTFKLTCRGGGGTTAAEAKLTVIAPPTLTFSASKTQVAENTGTQLRWRSTDATSCLASGDWSGSQGTSGTVDTGNLSSDKTYTLTCTGLNGEVAQTAKVEVVAAPRVTLNVSDDIVAPGESVTITWSVEDAQSCTASGAPFAGTKNIQGSSETLSDLTKGAKTFKLTCRGAGGTTAAEAKLTVIAKPTLTFSASKTQIAENAGTQLKWRATDATSCLASGDWSGSQGASGSFDTGTLTSDKTYTLTCIGLNGEVEQTVKVEVIPAPTVSLSLSDTLVEPGTAVTLSWESEYAQSCTASGGGWSGSRTLSGTETVTFATPGRRVFTLTCSGVGGPKAATVELGVFPKPKILSFTADPTLIQVGQTSTLKWQTKDASACAASGAWSGSQTLSSPGTVSSTLTQRTNVFTLTCAGDGGEISSSVTVEARGAPEVTLAVDRTLVTSGERVMLTWSSKEATSCEASGAWSGNKALSGSEASTALEPGNYAFTLRCENAAGAATKSVSVESKPPQITYVERLGNGTTKEIKVLDFGLVSADRSVVKWLLLKNVGEMNLVGLSAVVSSDAVDQFIIDSRNCGSIIYTGQECVIQITYRPTVSGLTSASLDIKTDGRRVVSIPLVGTGAFSSLTVLKVGNGSVTSSPAGVNCGDICSANFTTGRLVTITAVAANDFMFFSWTGACIGSVSSCNVLMDKSQTVTATFIQGYLLSLVKTGSGGGSIVSSPEGISCGSVCSLLFKAGASVTLTPTAANNSVFTGWTGCAATNGNACTVTVDQAKSVTATFALKKFALTVAKAGTGGGSVASEPAGVNCGTACSSEYTIGTSVTLTAFAANDSTFTGWTGCATANGNACTVTVDQAKSVTANFSKKPVLFVQREGIGRGLLISNPEGITCGEDCSEAYDLGSTVTILATPDSDSVFLYWKNCPLVSGNRCTVKLEQSTSVRAVFTLNKDRIGSSSEYPASRLDVLRALTSEARRGYYWLDPDGSGKEPPFRAYINDDTFGGNWILVRRISTSTPQNPRSGWDVPDDDLSGTNSFGNGYGDLNSAYSWGGRFQYFVDEKTQFLFMTGGENAACVLVRGDVSKDPSEPRYPFGGTDRYLDRNTPVVASKGVGVAAGDRTTVYHLGHDPASPFIGCNGTHVDNQQQMLYAEGGLLLWTDFKDDNGGVNVFVRNAELVSFSSKFVDFGNQNTNEVSTEIAIKVNSDQALTMAFRLEGPDADQFSLSVNAKQNQSNSCLAYTPQKACSAYLTFKPTSTGLKRAWMVVDHNGPETFSILGLKGVGQSPAASAVMSESRIASGPPTNNALLNDGGKVVSTPASLVVNSDAFPTRRSGQSIDVNPLSSAAVDHGVSTVAAVSEDKTNGAKYLLRRVNETKRALVSKWVLEYFGDGERIHSKMTLAETSRGLWRLGDDAGISLPTSGWVGICSDQIWTVQDGYRLITHRFDKTLTAANRNELEIARSAEVSLVTDAVCGTGGSLTISGFVFGVSDTEPPLSVEPVPAHRFKIELSRSGEVLRKTLTPTEFLLPAVCTSSKNELTQFCTEAKRAVGW